MQTGKKCQGSAYIFFTVTKEYIIVHFTSSHAGLGCLVLFGGREIKKAKLDLIVCIKFDNGNYIFVSESIIYQHSTEVTQRSD